jgi:hypothetical protein
VPYVLMNGSIQFFNLSYLGTIAFASSKKVFEAKL